jgi:hypothetical protein
MIGNWQPRYVCATCGKKILTILSWPCNRDDGACEFVEIKNAAPDEMKNEMEMPALRSTDDVAINQKKQAGRWLASSVCTACGETNYHTKKSDFTKKGGGNMGKLIDRAKKEIDTVVWKPEHEGDGIEGTLTNIRRGDKYDSMHYHIHCEDGIDRVVMAGADTVLGGLLTHEHLQIGDEVAVVFLGEKESKNGRRYKSWAVASEKHHKENDGAATHANGADADDSIPF